MPDEPRFRIIRTVRFSCGHRFWNPNLSPQENQVQFGKFASPYNHGHNYVLDVCASGFKDQKTGMVVNIKRLDDLLQKQIVQKLDLKSLNDEVLEFSGLQPSLEMLLIVVRNLLLDPGAQSFFVPTGLETNTSLTLDYIKINEMPGFWATWTPKLMTLTRTYDFAAAHRLFVPKLSEEENIKLFGKCTNSNGHGHNYVLEVTIHGKVDQTTGMMVDLVKLDEEVNSLIIERFDHKFLDKDLPEFWGLPTTTENVTQAIYDSLKQNLSSELYSVRLYETARSAFEICSDE